MSLVKKYYIIIGHNQFHIMTLLKQISLFTEEALIYSQGDSLANHIPQQVKEREKKMKDISGRACLEQLEKFNHVGLWAKTFSALLIGQGGLVFHEVQADLEAEGYEVWPYVLPAVSVNAPHRRDRVWFVAYANLCGNDTTEGGKRSFRKQPNKKQQRDRRAMQTNGLSNEWPTPHPNGVRLQQRKNTGEMGGGQTEMGGQRSESTNAIETNGKVANVTHPNRNGLNQRNGNDEEQPGKGGFNALSNAHTGDEYGDVADTGHEGLQGFTDNESTGGSGQESDKFTSGCVRSNWQNFPTQSPICTGDDGLSSRLDNITFSKWRNESIKAAGNAIVPQVVLQIFKAIQQYETTPPLEATL